MAGVGRPFLHPRVGDRYRLPSKCTVIVVSVEIDEVAFVYKTRDRRPCEPEEGVCSVRWMRKHGELVWEKSTA